MRKRFLSALLGLALSLATTAAALAEEYVINLVVDGKPVALSIVVDGSALTVDSPSVGVEVASVAPVLQEAAQPQSATRTATVNRDANLRGGPGTNHAVVGGAKQGQVLTIVGNNPAGDWYQLADSKWIAASLVTVTTAGPAPTNPTPIPNTLTTAPTATSVPTTAPTLAPTATSTQAPSSPACDPSYPGVCIPPYPPDLNCDDVGIKRFQVVGADPHGFDRDNDGIGCES